MSLTFTRVLVPVLVASLLISCSASQHAGVINVKEPPLSENDPSVWFVYYQDQFDAFKGNVLPPNPQYPKSAHEGYDQAKDDWNKEVKYARGRKTLAYMSVGMLFGAATVFVITSMLRHEETPSW